MITYKIVKIQENQPEQSVVLTDEEMDAIYSAMDDYQHYGDDEAEIADSIQSKLNTI